MPSAHLILATHWMQDYVACQDGDMQLGISWLTQCNEPAGAIPGPTTLSQTMQMKGRILSATVGRGRTNAEGVSLLCTIIP